MSRTATFSDKDGESEERRIREYKKPRSMLKK